MAVTYNASLIIESLIESGTRIEREAVWRKGRDARVALLGLRACPIRYESRYMEKRLRRRFIQRGLGDLGLLEAHDIGLVALSECGEVALLASHCSYAWITHEISWIEMRDE